MDKSAFHTIHCMINVESLAARRRRWEVLQCPAVPKAERIVDFLFSGRSSLTLMVMLLTSSTHPSSFPGRLPSVVLGSSSRRAAVGWCYSIHLCYWQSLSLRSWFVHYPLVLCFLDCWYVQTAVHQLRRSWKKLKISNCREDRYCQPLFFNYWQGQQKSFVREAYVAISNWRDKYITHNCIQSSQVLLQVTHCS